MVKISEQVFLDRIEQAINDVKQLHADEIKALELEIAELRGELKFYKETHIKIVQPPVYVPPGTGSPCPNELYPTITCDNNSKHQIVDVPAPFE